MPERFEGTRNDNFGLVDDLKGVVSDAMSIKDDIGAKKANVYFYERNMETDEVVWRQILPTPNIVDLSHNVKQIEAGVIQAGDLFLNGIPIQNYNSEDLETASMNENIEKYWVIKESNTTRAYTTTHIKRNLLTYDVHISRYESINENELTIPEAP